MNQVFYKMEDINKPIRSLLLAAGMGTRLRPITIDKPKCLVEVGNKPMLGWWLKHLETINCKEVIVNTHYHSDQVSEYIKNYKSDVLSIIERYEHKLLGTAGTLLENANFFEGCTGMLIHSDNATDIDLNKLIQAHQNRPRQCLMTMLTFTTNVPQKCGIVELDSDGIVQNFHEKVENPPGNRANGAVYVFDQELIEILQDSFEKPKDFSTEVLPRLIGRIYTHHTLNQFIDIGTPESLNRARQIWQNFDPGAS